VCLEGFPGCHQENILSKSGTSPCPRGASAADNETHPPTLWVGMSYSWVVHRPASLTQASHAVHCCGRAWRMAYSRYGPSPCYNLARNTWPVTHSLQEHTRCIVHRCWDGSCGSFLGSIEGVFIFSSGALFEHCVLQSRLGSTLQCNYSPPPRPHCNSHPGPALLVLLLLQPLSCPWTFTRAPIVSVKMCTPPGEDLGLGACLQASIACEEATAMLLSNSSRIFFH
jgi:hypothetical protein